MDKEKYTMLTRNQKKAGVAILISDKADFKARRVIRDKEGYYMIRKGVILKDIAILNVYVSNNTASTYLRQKLLELQGEIDEPTIIIGDLNTNLPEMDRCSRWKTVMT